MLTGISEFINNTAFKLNNLDFSESDFSKIDNFPLNSKQCLYVVDWQDSKISYQRDVEKILGYNENEFTLKTILNIAHPDDLNLIKRITQAVVYHLISHDTDLSENNSHQNITYRFRKKDGTYIKILRQSTLFEATKNGRMKSNLSLLTDISFFDKTDAINWEFSAPLVEQDAFRNEIYKEFNDFFTPREIDVIKLISNNFKTKDIAKKLFISEHTIYSHRKNILKKSNCHNAKELIEFCNKIGVL